MNNDERKRELNRRRVKRHRKIKTEINDIATKRARYEERKRRNNTESANGIENHRFVYHRTMEDIGSAECLVGGTHNEEEQVHLDQFENAYPIAINKSDDTEELQVEEYENESCSEVESYHREEESLNDSNESVQSQVLDIPNPEQEEVEQLRLWAIDSNIPHSNLDRLLAILRQRLLPNLPRSSKTFLNTNAAMYNIQEMRCSDGSMGKFVYFGITKNLTVCVLPQLHNDNKILLQINVDGLPLWKSGAKQFWPILCKVYSDSDVYTPFPVAIYSGDSKPASIHAFMTDFVLEVNNLLMEGVLIAGVQYQVQIHSFICDTPARAFLKCIKGHGGFWACERCETRGERVEKRTVYPETNCRERTDESFRLQRQHEHHHGRTPLLDIEPPIDMVSTFVLDYMHLCCVGIMKKLAEYWVLGKNQSRFQRTKNTLGVQQRYELTRRLLDLKKFIPVEFQRKPRNINRITQWKATELRFFLLYCGPVVLRGILNPNVYKHFLLLHTACRILCCREYAFIFNTHAKVYLTRFFILLGDLYGRQFQTLNSHNLIHMANDVMNMNCTLNNISAFPFESLLGKIKQYLRNANRPLAQVCRRMHEVTSINKKPSIPSTILIIKSAPTVGEERMSINRLKYKGFILTNKVPNNLVLLSNDLILTIRSMDYPQNRLQEVEIEGNVWKVKSSIFKYPTKSNDLKMWELVSEPSTRVIRCNVTNVQRKMVQIRITSRNPSGTTKIYAIPFLH